MLRFFKYFIFSTLLFSLVISTRISFAEPTEKEVLAAMKKATGFMVDTVSNHGGYLWRYAADMSAQWGEIIARPTQIIVQEGTPSMGFLLLDAYNSTGDEYFLRCAEKAANALIYGQHPLGGWHYLIDFDMPGLEQFYKDVIDHSMNIGKEYQYYYGNCTYDDDTTQGATRFLLRLYMTTLDPVYREPLLKALNFILISQYPNGGWPQRYPLRYDNVVQDGFADYTSYYTLNDNVMRNIIDVLIEAYEKLGNEEYLKAATRGVDFFISAQMPEPSAGWAEQYDMDMKPAWARPGEPPAVMPRQSEQCIRQLEDFYLMTGDRRYLKPIPSAITWLEESTVEILDNGRHKLARYYEPGTNLPLYRHLSESDKEVTYSNLLYYHDPSGSGEGGWVFTTVDVQGIKSDYERINALTPEEAIAAYKAKKAAKLSVQNVEPGKVSDLISSMDKRGAWIEDITVVDLTPSMIGTRDTTIIKGIETRTFINNMRTFINYLENIK